MHNTSHQLLVESSFFCPKMVALFWRRQPICAQSPEMLEFYLHRESFFVLRYDWYFMCPRMLCCAPQSNCVFLLSFLLAFRFKLCYNRSSNTPHVIELYALPAWFVGDIVHLMLKWVDLCVFSVPIYVCWDLDFWRTLLFNTDFQPPKLCLVFSHTFVLYHRAACLSASTGSFFLFSKRCLSTAEAQHIHGNL